MMSKQIVITVRSLFVAIVSVLVLAVFCFQSVHSVLAKQSTEDDSYAQLKTFTDVLSLVQKNYVEEVDFKNLVEGAIKGMLLTLDPHSGYLSPDLYNDLKIETKGEFGGLGIEITVKGGVLTVVSPIEDSPAYRAGIKAGDQIIKIGDEFAKDLSMVEAVKKMRGPKGTPITISVHREGMRDLIPYSVVRDVIKVKSVRSRMLDDRLGYVRLVQFQEDCADDFERALVELKKKAKGKDLQGLVIDLRNNPGGLLNQATRVSDIFLKDGLIVYTDGRLESQKQKYFAHDSGDEPNFPIVVLVNGGSASASEIVAGALQDAERAVILGTPSFGKGSVQTILDMENGGALRLTTALYYTRNGRSIQAEGIVPDVTVQEKKFAPENDADEDGDEGSPDLMPRKERDLPGALKNPINGDKPAESNASQGAPEKGGAESSKKSPPAGSDAKPGDEHILPGSQQAITAPMEKVLQDDPQLDEAMKLLHNWESFQRKAPVHAFAPGVEALS